MDNHQNSGFREIFESQYTWIEGFMRNVRRYPSKVAMIDPAKDRSWTYLQLNKDVNRLANALTGRGYEKGTIIMCQLLNSPEFAISYVTAHKAQMVFCPVSYRLSQGELALAIDDNKPTVFILEESMRMIVQEAVRLAHFKPSLLIEVNGESEGNIISYEDFTGKASDEEPVLSTDYNIYDETVRLFTSGTTGRQKGVPVVSINEVLSAHDVMIHFPMNSQDVTMNTTPWFHRGGLHCAGPCPTFYAGATLVIMEKFDAVMALESISRHGITFLVGVPTVLEAMADAQDAGGYDIQTLRGIVTMGSPLERSACIRYQKLLTPNIFNGYGTTESFWNTFLRPFNLPEHAGTAGCSCVDDEVRVVKLYDDRFAEPDDLVEMGTGEVGEVIIKCTAKSPYQYANNPEETRRKFYKGFLYTHDLGTWDKDQFITICGRKDDMIISSGENIYPVQVEEILNEHPKVKDSIVTAVPDKVRGQVVTAYVVRSDLSLTVEELDEYCKQNPFIANFKRPRYYRFISELPLNSSGKKQHNRMRQIADFDLKNGLLVMV